MAKAWHAEMVRAPVIHFFSVQEFVPSPHYHKALHFGICITPFQNLDFGCSGLLLTSGKQLWNEYEALPIYFFAIFLNIFKFFLCIWPLAGPNIAEREAALVEKARLASRDQVGC